MVDCQDPVDGEYFCRGTLEDTTNGVLYVVANYRVSGTDPSDFEAEFSCPRGQNSYCFSLQQLGRLDEPIP